jgi:hypothetical protein
LSLDEVNPEASLFRTKVFGFFDVALRHATKLFAAPLIIVLPLPAMKPLRASNCMVLSVHHAIKPLFDHVSIVFFCPHPIVANAVFSPITLLSSPAINVPDTCKLALGGVLKPIPTLRVYR